MADLNVGGIKASLSVDAQAWLQGLQDATKGLTAWERGVGRTFDRFNSALSKSMATARGHLTAFGLSVGASLGGAIVVFQEFDRAAREVNSIMRLSEREAGTYRGQIRQLTRELGLNVSATDSMRAAYAVASAGFTSAAEQQQVLTAGLRLAKAGVADTQVTLNALTGTLRAYGAGAAEAANYSDILFKTVELGQTTLPELAQTLSRVTLTASTAGVSFDQLGSAVAALTLKGVPTATAMDSLNQAMLQMLAPSAEAQKVLASVGLTAEDLGKTMRSQGLRAAIVQLFQATRGDVAALKGALGDVNSVKAILALGAGGGEEFARVEAGMADRGGAAARGAAEISKSLSEQIGMTSQLLRDLALSVGEALMPVILRVNAGLRTLVEVVGRIPEPVKQTIAQIAAGAAALSLFAAGITYLLPIGLNLVKMFAAGGLVAQFTAFTAGLKLAVSALGVAVVAMAKFAAVVAVVGAAVAANLGGIRDFFATTFGFISDVVGSTMAEIGEMLSELGQVVGIDLSAIARAFSGFSVDILAMMSDAMRLVLAVVQVAVTSMVAAFRGLFILIGGIIRAAGPVVASALRGMANVLSGVWDLMTLAMEGRWDDLFIALGKGVERAAVSLKAAVVRLLDNIINEIANTVSRFEVLGFRMFDSLGQGMRRGAAATQRIIAGGATGGVQGAVRAGAAGGAGAGFLDQLIGFFRPSAPEAKPGATTAVESAIKQLQADLSKPTRETAATPIAGGRGGVGTGKMSPAEMRAFIRREADVTGDIEGLTKEALEATFKLVENAMKAGIRLGITSGKRYGSGRSLHDIGQALDITIPGEQAGSMRAGAVASALAEGTGFKSGINEYLQEAMKATGATGPHVHLAMREDGRGIPGFFKVAGNAANALEVVNEKLETFALELGRVAMQFLSPEQRKRAEIETRYSGLRQRGIEAGASPEMLARVDQMRRQELAQLAKEEQDAAIQSIQQTAAEDQRATEERRQARMADVQEQRREKFAQMDFDRRLNRATLDDQIRLYEEELASRNLNKEQRRTMQLELYELHQQDIEARLTDQADYNERWLKAELERLALADQANESVQLRQIALNDQLRRLEAQRTDDSVRSLTFVEQQFAGFFSSVLSGQQNLGTAFKQLWTSIKNHVIQQISEMIVKSKAFEGLFGWLSGPTGIIAKLFGAHGGGTAGAPGSMETVPSFHTGGLVSRGSMRASTGMKLRSDEILAKLQTGEVVLSRDQVAAMKQSQDRGSGVNVYVSPSMVQAVDPDRLGRIIGRDIMWRMQGA